MPLDCESILTKITCLGIYMPPKKDGYCRLRAGLIKTITPSYFKKCSPGFLRPIYEPRGMLVMVSKHQIFNKRVGDNGATAVALVQRPRFRKAPELNRPV